MHLYVSYSAGSSRALTSSLPLGHWVTGCEGLLDVLETQLGLSSANEAYTLRVLAYMQALKSVDNGQRFYTQSLAESDAYTVTESLLDWRDSLYEQGWEATPTTEKRLADLAAVEAIAKDSVGQNTAQRIAAITAALENQKTGLEHVTLLAEEALWAKSWKELWSSLRASGVELTVATPQVRGLVDPVQSIQSSLLSNTPADISDFQGRALLVRASDNLISAQWLARYLEDGEGSVAILAANNADLLEQALIEAGLPAQNMSAACEHRPALQVLPLFMALQWGPLDVDVLLQYLSHPLSPIPARLRYRLAEAVASQPGVGGELWQDAINDFTENEGESKAKEVIAEWLTFTTIQGEQCSDVTELTKPLQSLGNWLAKRLHSPDLSDAERSLFFTASGQVSELKDALELWQEGQDDISRITFDGLLQRVLKRGSDQAGITAQSSPSRLIRIVRQSEAFIPELEQGGFAEVIVWGNPEQGGARKSPWRSGEREALAAEGVELADEKSQAAEHARQAVKPLLAAQQKVLIVQHASEEEDFPLLQRLSALGVELPSHKLDLTNLDVLGVMTEPQDSIELCEPKRWLQVDHELLGGKRDGAESYSSLNTLLDNPVDYVLKYMAKIYPGRLLQVSKGSLLKGSLAHRVVEHFFTEFSTTQWQAMNEKKLIQWLTPAMDNVLITEGASLLMPGQQIDVDSFRQRTQRAFLQLVEHLQAADVKQINVEEAVSGDFSMGSLQGYIDLLVQHNDGSETVIDIKLGSKKYRQDELKSYTHYQLALYGLLRHQSTQKWPSLAFFIINDAELVSLPTPHFAKATIVDELDEHNNAELCTRVDEVIRWRREQLREGEIEVTLQGTDADETKLPPDDTLSLQKFGGKYCDYTSLLGWS